MRPEMLRSVELIHELTSEPMLQDVDIGFMAQEWEPDSSWVWECHVHETDPFMGDSLIEALLAALEEKSVTNPRLRGLLDHEPPRG